MTEFRIYRIVFVVCHPDDEAIWVGGLLHELSKFQNIRAYVICLSGRDPNSPREREFDQARREANYAGGVVMGFADTLGGLCAFLNLPDVATGTTTIESKTNFLRGVRDGHIEGVARPLHTGRTVVVIETDVFDAAGKRVAKILQTQAVLGAR